MLRLGFVGCECDLFGGLVIVAFWWILLLFWLFGCGLLLCGCTVNSVDFDVSL